MINDYIKSEREQQADAPYPTGVGAKFFVDGRVRRFPGNTIICHLSADSPLYQGLKSVYAALETGPLADKYTLLPQPSWHMTVFEGVCDEVRLPGYWPGDLALDAPLEDCNRLFAEKLQSFDLPALPPFKLEIAGLRPLYNGIGLHLEPAGAAENRRLRDLRDQLSELLQLRQATHATYVFHLSLGYLLRHLTDDERAQLQDGLMQGLKQLPRQIELGAPEFCLFDDMFAFHRQFYLRNQA